MDLGRTYLAGIPAHAPDDADPAGDPTVELVDLGADLHDRFALPFFLRLDLEEVLAELDAVGLGLAAELRERLLDDAHRLITSAPFGPLHVEMRRAIEFWPVFGDQTGHVGTSRLARAHGVHARYAVAAAAGRERPFHGLTE